MPEKVGHQPLHRPATGGLLRALAHLHSLWWGLLFPLPLSLDVSLAVRLLHHGLLG